MGKSLSKHGQAESIHSRFIVLRAYPSCEPIHMRLLSGFTIWMLLIVAVRAGDPQAEVVELKRQVARLEAENQDLRKRLAEIATLAREVDVPSSTALTIRLASDNWGDAQPADILEVLQSAAHPLWQSAGQPALQAIEVVQDSEGPRVNYQRGPGNAYVVLLNVEGRLWARFSYQFAHELSHILANFRDVPNPQMWLEESLCECASLYSLRAMGRAWKTAPPYPNWTPYADSLTAYATDRIGEAEAVPQGDLADWYSRHQSRLEQDSINRKLNLIVAVKLLKIFERHPSSWRVLRSLNRGEPSESLTLRRYLAGWHGRVEAKDRIVVEQIAELFGIVLG